MTAQSPPMGMFLCEEATAAQRARSAAGSVRDMPPAMLM